MSLVTALKAFKASSACKRAFVIGADATGDIPHVHAALRGDDDKAADDKSKLSLAVVIFEWDASAGEGVRRKLRLFGIPDTRMLVLSSATILADDAETRDRLATLRAKHAANPRNLHRDLVSWACTKAKLDPKDLTSSTLLATDALSKDAVRKGLHADLRGAKGIDPKEDDVLVDFWRAKGIGAGDERHTVVLWGRTSGKAKTTATTFGPHPYGDSSTTGLVQVATECLKQKWHVVLTGDIPVTKRDRYPRECSYIGAFWNDPYWRGAKLSQRDQVRLFYILKRMLKEKGRRMVHVGMRSGNLDYYAFAGQPIVYLVAVGFDDRRIEQLAKAVPSHWTQSRPERSPRIGYSLEWDADWLAVAGATNLGELLGAPALQRERSRFGSTGCYPTDPETQLNANLLYRCIKAELKHAEPGVEDGSALLEGFLEQRKRRGFSATYLQTLVGTMRGTLERASSTSETPAH